MRPRRSVQRLRLSSAVGTAALMGAALATLLGCQPPPKPAAPPPPPPPVPTATQVTQAQQQFATLDPHARVGHVDSVSSADHLAVVAGIPLSDVKVGDTVSFAGPDHQAFATGTITDLDNRTSADFSFLIVDYQKSSTGGRDPSAGDLAITIPLGK